MRPVLATLLALVLRQTAGGYGVEPAKGPETTVHAARESPEETQDRLFVGARFWRLDPGRVEVETWWTQEAGRNASSVALLQAEVEIGLTPHLQLDLYQNLNASSAGVDVEGEQIEVRYSFGRVYNQLPLNPVLYLEWHPRHQAQDRAEVRLLLGGDLAAHGLWAFNAYAESNADGFRGAGNVGADAEVGGTAALSFPALGKWLRLGAEAQVGADEHGGQAFQPVALVGPNVLLAAHSVGLKLTATSYFGLMPMDPRVRLLVIAGWQI